MRRDLRTLVIYHGHGPVVHTPRVSKVDHKDPHKYDSSPSRGPVLQPFALVPANDARHNEVAGSHTRGTGDENLLAPDLIHPEHGRNGEEELDNADDTGGEKGGGISG